MSVKRISERKACALVGISHSWPYIHGVQLKLIQPEKPTQNAYIESFNGKFRDECLNEHWFKTLNHARFVNREWRTDYNENRPHSMLGYKTPAERRDNQ